ncbi:MAG TPA: HD domain-containing phosphohydrolase [bacterium]|jgi:putative nucleotidyltransferase with HDIG domain
MSSAIIHLLEDARRQMRTHLLGHPEANEAVHALAAEINGALGDGGSIRFDLIDGALYLDAQRLLDESVYAAELVSDLVAEHVGVLEFTGRVPFDELATFVELLARVSRQEGALAQMMAAADITHIRVASVHERHDVRGPAQIDPREVYRVGLRTIGGVNYEAAQGETLDLRSTRLLVSSMVDVVLRDPYAFTGLAALRQYDEDTSHHSINVAALALMIGLHLRLDEPMLQALGTAALLHDIGKMNTPRTVLRRPGPLGPQERVGVDRHPVFGAQLLQHLGGPAKAALIVALEHHVDYDLSGYPSITGRRRPHLFTRIIAVADFFDAVTSARRTYRRPMLPDQAMRAIVLNAGTKFDPAIAAIALNLLGAYPVGSVVQLSSREVAVVYRATDGAPFLPQVRIVKDPAGIEIDPVMVSLVTDPRRILHALEPRTVGINPGRYL